jgi:hypothetical protein
MYQLLSSPLCHRSRDHIVFLLRTSGNSHIPYFALKWTYLHLITLVKVDLLIQNFNLNVFRKSISRYINIHVLLYFTLEKYKICQVNNEREQTSFQISELSWIRKLRNVWISWCNKVPCKTIGHHWWISVYMQWMWWLFFKKNRFLVL